VGEGQILRDAIGIRRINDYGPAEAAAALRIFGREEMALAGMPTEHFARASDLKPLGHRLFRFDTFGTTHLISLSLLQKEAGI
jgi:hypothetical protein